MAIDTKSVFCRAYNSANYTSLNFEQFLGQCEAIARLDEPAVSGAALANTRGAWYAWLIAIESIRFGQSNPLASFLVKLPNVSSFDSISLYEESISKLVVDFREKLSLAGDVNLTTSNPDYVIISRELGYALPDITGVIAPVNLEQIDTFYRNFVGRCNLDQIVGYLGAKSSVRPDRRIQLLHEGSLTKAIYTHLQTRLWLINPKGIKYYAVSMSFGPADLAGLKSVATHSIASSAMKPEPAIDIATSVFDTQTAHSFFNQVLV
ncbi:Cfr10I/Bse634I family restriction endonuclease [Undibacterium sp. Dicai25W]|uniref:Cfr10I/Bse634I family restriction endonuclease n=1 Tax=Undibacterium sp. Dicai25W TaxID=3413034 RepID=UPI003BEFC0F9